ncbi:MAG: LVIVD repeat-containing protein [Devosia sp.]
MSDIRPESARNFRFVGYTDMGGQADGTQLMVSRGHAYVAHPFSNGATVLDVSDPRSPRVVNRLPVHRKSWSIHLQAANDLLLVVEEFNFYSVFNEGSSYYDASADGMDSSRFGKRGEDFSAGMRVYDIKDPANPRPIGFMEVEGLGLHRIWWTGGRYAYASAFLDGFTDHILIVIDMADPARPTECGRWWLPGMNKAAGEKAEWPGRVALHHAIVSGNTAYAAWRDGGFTALDVSDPSDIKLIAQRNWFPPYGGGTHTCLPLPDRGLLVVADEAVRDIDVEGIKHTWIFDIRAADNPISIATVPIPADQDYVKKGGHFGPHNLWENRPEGYQSSRYLFETYQNAGLRVFDLKNPYRPEEIGYFVPPPPAFSMDARAPGVKQILHSADLYVDKRGLVYISDFNAGLYIAEWTGDAAVFQGPSNA